MAHFAKLDENNIVLEVHVVNNDALDPNNEEASGIAFLTEWSGGYSNWKQTSYNGTFRKRYANKGDKYNPDFDVFITPSPFPSWKLNYTTFEWEAPIAKPQAINGYAWRWSEYNKEWVQVAIPTA
jgi:hypothetical protein